MTAEISLQQAGLCSHMHIIGKCIVLLEQKIGYLVCLTDMNFLPITISSSTCLRERKAFKMNLWCSRTKKQSHLLIKQHTRRCRNCTGAPALRPTTKLHLIKIVAERENKQRNCFLQCGSLIVCGSAIGKNGRSYGPRTICANTYHSGSSRLSTEENPNGHRKAGITMCKVCCSIQKGEIL